MVASANTGSARDRAPGAEHTGISLNEDAVICAVASATDDLADRQIIAVSPQVWEELHRVLDRPPTVNSRIAALLAEPSTIDSGWKPVSGSGRAGDVPTT